MPKITSLGHIGLHVNDFPTMLDFYTRILGFTVTDENPAGPSCFLSAQPENEHHEILLTSGRHTPPGTKLIQQISMHVNSIADLKEFHQVFLDEGVKEERIVTHGNTASIYFRDPENNYLEIYYSIPIEFPQPFSEPINIDRDVEDILAQIDSLRKSSGTSQSLRS